MGVLDARAVANSTPSHAAGVLDARAEGSSTTSQGRGVLDARTVAGGVLLRVSATSDAA